MMHTSCKAGSTGSGSIPSRGGSLPSKMTAPYVHGTRHLLDDSVLEETCCANSEGNMAGLGKQVLSMALVSFTMDKQ